VKDGLDVKWLYRLIAVVLFVLFVVACFLGALSALDT
jgi:hypothetical protein